MIIGTKEIALFATGIAGAVGAAFAWSKLSESHGKQNDSTTTEAHHVDTGVESNGSVINTASAQAESELINTINTIRLNALFRRLNEISINESKASAEIIQLKSEIEKIINSNRGGSTGMHGFIGESCQVHIANTKSFMRGEKPLYVLLDDNSMTDYLRGMQFIQQKACQSDNHLGLDHICNHMEKYPEFVEQGGVYQIPKDFYEKFIRMKNTSEDVALKFRKEDLRLWKAVHRFIESNPDVEIEPMEVTYDEIQAGKVSETIKGVESSSERKFNQQKTEAKNLYAPTVSELLKIASISALIEETADGSATLVSFLYKRKSINELDREDWIIVLKNFVAGSIRGAARACIVYILTNFFRLSSTIASTASTLIFSIIKNTKEYLGQKKGKAEYYQSLVWDSLAVILSGIGAEIGKKVLKKNPVLGSIIGSCLFSGAANYSRKIIYA